MDYELDLKGFDVFTEEERLHLQSIPNGVDSVKRNLSFGSLGYGVEDIEGNPISVR